MDTIEKINSKSLQSANFTINNWIPQGVQNPILVSLHEKDVGLFLDETGEFFCRAYPDGDFKKIEKSKLAVLLASRQNLPKPLTFFTGKNEHPADIKANEMLVVCEKFTPFEHSEFYQKSGRWYRTAFKPTIHMSNNSDFAGLEGIPNTLNLLKNLCNNDSDRLEFFLNWLAGFFQTLRKSQQAFVFKGAQGTGKGIFAEYILKPLFGESQVITVDDDRLSTVFKSWISGKLFYVLNEISATDKRTRKKVKAFIKQLITDPDVQSERKFQDSRTEKLFGNVVIFSNETLPIEIEPTDRRFTVFQTGPALKRSGIDTAEMVAGIKQELPQFTAYLKQFGVIHENYDKCLDTPEKSALISATTDRYQLFISMLKKHNPELFFPEGEPKFIGILEKGFKQGFTNSELLEIFTNYFDDGHETSRSLPRKLRVADPIIFNPEKAKKVHGYPVFLIPKEI
jgi:hypothetical protein